MLTTDEANHYWCGRIFRKKVSYAFPEDHNNSQCFVLLKCLEAAPAESIRKGTKKLAKTK